MERWVQPNEHTDQLAESDHSSKGFKDQLEIFTIMSQDLLQDKSYDQILNISDWILRLLELRSLSSGWSALS